MIALRDASRQQNTQPYSSRAVNRRLKLLNFNAMIKVELKLRVSISIKALNKIVKVLLGLVWVITLIA